MRCTDFSMPLTGKLLTIEEVPDEVFNTRAMGDGFAIELEGDEVKAPCDSTVDSIYPTGHAVLLKCDNGINVMIHVGLDSYAIQGMNEILCSVGDCVKKGQVLVKTNAESLKKKANSVISPIVFLAGEKVTLQKPSGTSVTAGEEGVVVIESEE